MTVRIIFALAFIALATRATHADEYPSRTVRLLSGAAPGTVMDVVAHHFADKLAPILRQAVIVESKPSAGGIVALQTLARSAPDGHTLALVNMAQMSVAPTLFHDLPYDTVKDFTHVGILFRGPQVLVVHPDVKARSMGELVALARRKEMRYSSPGNGTPTHIYMEYLCRAAGIHLQHIPYKGTASLLAAVAGDVDMLLEGAQIVAPQVHAHKLRAIAVTGARRVALLPDVPTFSEQGIDGMDPVWVGVVAPRGVPDPVVRRIHDAFEQLTGIPEIRASFEQAGRYFTVGTPEQMRETIKAEIPRWQSIVESA